MIVADTVLIPACICGQSDWTRVIVEGVPIEICECGILHQHVEMTSEELAEWYRLEYPESVYSHTYEQDRAVARKRIEAYGFRVRGRVLDVGCGNGAFVDEVRELGIQAEGQDLCKADHEGSLESIGFPERSFDLVTLHDVLEHVPDPGGLLREVRRIARDWVIVDFPDFFHPDGRHHWKSIEHIWYLTECQLYRLIEWAEFRIVSVDKPIPAKLVVYCQ